MMHSNLGSSNPTLRGAIPTAGGTPVHPSLLAKQSPSASTPLAHAPLATVPRRGLQPASSCRVPDRAILRADDVAPWLQSEAFVRTMWFVQAVNQACAGRTASSIHAVMDRAEMQPVRSVVALLDTLDGWISAIPPEPQQGRFGNRTFRVFLGKLADEAERLVAALVGDGLRDAVPELAAYLVDAFGNATRLDYGSGHELAFVHFLGGLELVGFFGTHAEGEEGEVKDVFAGIALVAMARYLGVVRRLQTTYTLEPAGSHGVWGLDDFQFVPYYWGSAQLIDHKHLKPSAVTDKEQAEHFAKDYLYFGCIDYIYRTKQGPFFEHSPILYDISGVAQWAKVNGGMLKMYVAEVLSKFPIVQHVKFGSLFPFRPIDA
ncbi:Serine/threonine-protein phosphatase 2A activator 1 [Blastocladiella emersonii ATCC 22665]|nr:Serine/threonine-protein phosphatase 2A activator 1 [Blastocladiella emersonii ATCC 22665]